MRPWTELIRRCAHQALDFLAPPSCAFCAASGPALCHRCRKILPLNDRCCARCADPLETAVGESSLCVACGVTPPPFRRAYAPLRYLFPVANGIRALKFHGHLYYVPAFAPILEQACLRHFADCDALVAVPLHKFRYMRRGFNQAEELAKAISAGTGVPVIHSVRRVRATVAQSGLDAAERRRNLRAAFQAAEPLPCRHPLIIDDVMTTGETCRAITDVLLQAGAESVSVLAVARAARTDHAAA